MQLRFSREIFEKRLIRRKKKRKGSASRCRRSDSWIHNSFDRSISFLVRRYAGISFLLCYISFLRIYRERSALKKFFSRERTCQSAVVWPCECNRAERYCVFFKRIHRNVFSIETFDRDIGEVFSFHIILSSLTITIRLVDRTCA